MHRGMQAANHGRGGALPLYYESIKKERERGNKPFVDIDKFFVEKKEQEKERLERLLVKMRKKGLKEISRHKLSRKEFLCIKWAILPHGLSWDH